MHWGWWLMAAMQSGQQCSSWSSSWKKWKKTWRLDCRPLTPTVAEWRSATCYRIYNTVDNSLFNFVYWAFFSGVMLARPELSIWILDGKLQANGSKMSFLFVHPLCHVSECRSSFIRYWDVMQWASYCLPCKSLLLCLLCEIRQQCHADIFVGLDSECNFLSKYANKSTYQQFESVVPVFSEIFA